MAAAPIPRAGLAPAAMAGWLLLAAAAAGAPAASWAAPAVIPVHAAGAAAASEAPALAFSTELGEARDPASGRLLYREQHWLRRDAAGRLRGRLVLYRCPDGQAFARKRMDYADAPLAPAFDLDDARTGYREGLRRLPAPRLYVRSARGAAERSAALADAGVVADAGFDEFVRAHWATLAAGTATPLQFAVPARLRSYRFSLARTGTARIAGEDALLLRLRLDGLLAWFAPHLDVAYGLRSRRLLRFEGVSNLPDPAGGRNWLARIDFPAPARAAAPAAWGEALATPLGNCPVSRAADSASGRADTRAGAASN